ncbi:MAG: PAS domain-containing protein [Planctomycetes bacterium]|nr:PAS domain-containing protein [Planctomycetota bacterium]
MNEHVPFETIGLARDRIVELRAHLGLAAAAPGSAELDSSLHELEGLLEKLQARCTILRELLEYAGDIFFAKDPRGCYVMINPKGAGLFGKQAVDVVGQDDFALFDGPRAQRIMASDRATMESGVPSVFEETVEIDGLPARLRTTAVAWNEPGGKLLGVLGVTRDISERKRAEEHANRKHKRLQALAAEIVIAEENLRQTLATDMHNGLGQELALAKLRIATLRSESSPEWNAPLLRIEHLAEQAYRSLRSATYQLQPSSLHDLGLYPALQWLAGDTSARYGFDVEVEEQAGLAPLDGCMRTMLFRAVRELVLNSARHARPRTVGIRLDLQAGSMRVRVEDDGAGFDAASVESADYGLFGIREQLQHVGGSIDIDSRSGAGTLVTLVAPFSFELPVAV